MTSVPSLDLRWSILSLRRRKARVNRGVPGLSLNVSTLTQQIAEKTEDERRIVGKRFSGAKAPPSYRAKCGDKSPASLRVEFSATGRVMPFKTSTCSCVTKRDRSGLTFNQGTSSQLIRIKSSGWAF